MLTRTFTYENFDGVEITETLYFHLSKSELTEMELSVHGGLAERLMEIVNTKNGPEIMKQFKELLLSSYGVKSNDGKRFIKNAQLREEFEQSIPYDIMYMELCTDAEKAAEFIEKIIPSDIDMTEARAMLPQNMQTMK